MGRGNRVLSNPPHAPSPLSITPDSFRVRCRTRANRDVSRAVDSECPSQLQSYKGMRLQTWKQLVASSLLAMALVDLCIPGVCPEEGTALAFPGQALRMSAQAARPGSSPTAAEDDCCWCCAQVVPAPCVTVDAPPGAVTAHSGPPPAELRFSSHSLFHPPRA